MYVDKRNWIVVKHEKLEPDVYDLLGFIRTGFRGKNFVSEFFEVTSEFFEVINSNLGRISWY